MDIWTENGRKKEEEERKQREAQEKKESEKRAQERAVHEEWKNTLYTLALKIGKESGINHLHCIILGFRMRRTDLTSEEEMLSLIAEWAMNETHPRP